MKGNLLIAQTHGITAVSNAIIYGIIKEAEKHEEILNIYGALDGLQGIKEGRFITLDELSSEELEDMHFTPGAVLGNTIHEFEASDYEALSNSLMKNNIKYLINIGDRYSLKASENILNSAKGKDIKVIAIPASVINDITETDHCLGYGSAASYIYEWTKIQLLCFPNIEDMDKLYILKLLGDTEGWLGAAAALALRDMINWTYQFYLPEDRLNIETLIDDVNELHKKGMKKVAYIFNEGLLDGEGMSLTEKLDEIDMMAYLYKLIMDKKLKIMMSEREVDLSYETLTVKSSTDLEEAVDSGIFALKALLNGSTGSMVAIKRISNEPYKIDYSLKPLWEVSNKKRIFEGKYINKNSLTINESFQQYITPLKSVPAKLAIL